MVGVVLQVSGAILLAKGLIFRGEIELALSMFSITKIIGAKNKIISTFYKESIISILGAVWLVLGYFLPYLGLEINLDNYLWIEKLLFSLFGIIYMVTFSFVVSDIYGDFRASKVNEEEMLTKYSYIVKDMGFYITGINKQNDDED